MIIAFTGTRKGMTGKQYNQVKKLLSELDPRVVLHGDCTGSDAEFHKIAKDSRLKAIIKVYPSNLTARAYCDGDIIFPPDDPLKRNRTMVDACDKLIGAVSGTTEQMRSGTWSTIRYAKKLGKIVYVVYPDGSVS